MDGYDVETISIDGRTTALGSAGPFTLVVDRPTQAGGRGLGFNGGQLLNLAVAGCISNDLFREAAREGIELRRIRVSVWSDYQGDPMVSTPIEYQVEVAADAAEEAVRRLVAHVDRIAEIPNSLRQGTAVSLTAVSVDGGP
jgi:organic hydroperoxide reductase OsmC/OhrA